MNRKYLIVRKTSIRSITLSLGLAVAMLATPAHADSPQPPAPMPDQPLNTSLGRPLTTCTSFTRIKATADLTTVQTQNNSVNKSTDGLPTVSNGRVGQIVPIAPIGEVSGADEVTDLITVTVTADGVVSIEGSGYSETRRKRKAYNLDIDLEKCAYRAKHVSQDEQDKLDKEEPAKEQERSKGTIAGSSKLAKVNVASTTFSTGLKVVTKDPPRYSLAETALRLSWTTNSGTVIGAGQLGYCMGYTTPLNTHWYNSYCSTNGPYVSSSQASVSRAANYWNNDFAACFGSTAYSAHSISIIGYGYGGAWTNYNVSSWGAACSGLLSYFVYYY